MKSKITIWLMVLAILFGLPKSISAPTASYQSNLYLIEGNTVKAIVSPFNLRFPVYGTLIGSDERDLIRMEYPELADLLICMWQEESSSGKRLIGDHGKAIGHFQIWISKHPVSYECAMDFQCALAYTAEKIKEGKGFWWTSYKKCLHNNKH